MRLLTYSKRKPRPLGRGLSDRHRHETARLRPAGVGYGAKHNGRKHGRLDWVPAGRESVESKQQPLPDCACPPWHTGQAGRWHGPYALGPKGPRAGSLLSLAEERDARPKEIARPSNGRTIRHIPPGLTGCVHTTSRPTTASRSEGRATGEGGGEDTQRLGRAGPTHRFAGCDGRSDPESGNPRPSGRGGCQRGWQYLSGRSRRSFVRHLIRRSWPAVNFRAGIA